jgi:hypothetical protein
MMPIRYSISFHQPSGQKRVLVVGCCVDTGCEVPWAGEVVCKACLLDRDARVASLVYGRGQRVPVAQSPCQFFSKDEIFNPLILISFFG